VVDRGGSIWHIGGRTLPPKLNSFVAGGDPVFGQKVFNISQAQAETEVQPDRLFNAFWREAVAFEAERVLTFGHVRCLEMR